MAGSMLSNKRLDLAFVGLLVLFSLTFLPQSFLGIIPVTKWATPNNRTSDTGMLRPSEIRQHPIEALVADAKSRFANVMESQSKSLAEATTEYIRRYGREPPQGFGQWYKMAVQLGAPIIDDYDSIVASMEPFWGISAREIRVRAKMVIDTDDHIVGVSIMNQTLSPSKSSYEMRPGLAEKITAWTDPLLKYLPDMDIAINTHDECREVVPHDELSRRSSCREAEQDDIMQRRPFQFNLIRHQRTWPIAKMSCPPESSSRIKFLPEYEARTDLRFIGNISRSKDICIHPEAASQHGFLVSPDNFRFTNELVPIFSRSKMSTLQDILYPAPDYPGDYRSEQDMPWEEKENSLYWGGTTTDGYSQGGSWRHMHRHRLVQFVNDAKQKTQVLRRTNDGRWETHDGTMASLLAHSNVTFTQQKLCDEQDCEDIRKVLRFGEAQPQPDSFGYRFVFDADGQGLSGRYYRLLRSRSVVFKQTMLHESHDDRLVPWLHYVPISLGMAELPETLRFLTSDEGQAIARDIAEAGRDWTERALREDDAMLTWFRILLEYARLMDEARDENLKDCP